MTPGLLQPPTVKRPNFKDNNMQKRKRCLLGTTRDAHCSSKNLMRASPSQHDRSSHFMYLGEKKTLSYSIPTFSSLTLHTSVHIYQQKKKMHRIKHLKNLKKYRVQHFPHYFNYTLHEKVCIRLIWKTLYSITLSQRVSH